LQNLSHYKNKLRKGRIHHNVTSFSKVSYEDGLDQIPSADAWSTWSVKVHSLAELTYWEVLAFLMGLFGAVCVQLLSGRINTRGLFTGQKGDGSEYFSPERVQLLLFTLAAAFQFLSGVLRDSSQFPVVSDSWILLLGGSHVLYLGGKLGATFLSKS